MISSRLISGEHRLTAFRRGGTESVGRGPYGNVSNINNSVGYSEWSAGRNTYENFRARNDSIRWTSGRRLGINTMAGYGLHHHWMAPGFVSQYSVNMGRAMNYHPTGGPVLGHYPVQALTVPYRRYPSAAYIPPTGYIPRNTGRYAYRPEALAAAPASAPVASDVRPATPRTEVRRADAAPGTIPEPIVTRTREGRDGFDQAEASARAAIAAMDQTPPLTNGGTALPLEIDRDTLRGKRSVVSAARNAISTALLAIDRIRPTLEPALQQRLDARALVLHREQERAITMAISLARQQNAQTQELLSRSGLEASTIGILQTSLQNLNAEMQHLEETLKQTRETMTRLQTGS